MTRLEIATLILAGMAANPSKAYVQAPVAIKGALELADRLIKEERNSRHEAPTTTAA